MKRKKRILMCYHSSAYGGVERQIFDIIQGLSPEFDFYVAVPSGDLLNDYLKAGAVKHYNVFAKYKCDISYMIRIYQICKEEKIDIVHAHEIKTGLQAIFAATLSFTCKSRILHVHTPFSEWKHPNIVKKTLSIFNFLVNFIVGNFFATDVLALNQSIKKVRIEKEKIWNKKITVIGNGTNIENMKYDFEKRSIVRERFGVKDSDILFGCIARFTTEKGHVDIVEAVNLIKKLKPELLENKKFLFGGGGRLKNEIQELVKKYYLEDMFIFTGYFEEDEKASLYSALDIFLFATHAEGFGISLIEAMSIGLPSLVSNLPVLQEVGGKGAIYFEARNHDALAKKIIDVANDEYLRKIVSINAKNKVKEYTMENFWTAYRDLYNKNFLDVSKSEKI